MLLERIAKTKKQPLTFTDVRIGQVFISACGYAILKLDYDGLENNCWSLDNERLITYKDNHEVKEIFNIKLVEVA